MGKNINTNFDEFFQEKNSHLNESFDVTLEKNISNLWGKFYDGKFEGMDEKTFRKLLGKVVKLAKKIHKNL
jgi:hypothetical protein